MNQEPLLNQVITELVPKKIKNDEDALEIVFSQKKFPTKFSEREFLQEYYKSDGKRREYLKNRFLSMKEWVKTEQKEFVKSILSSNIWDKAPYYKGGFICNFEIKCLSATFTNIGNYIFIINQNKLSSFNLVSGELLEMHSEPKDNIDEIKISEDDKYLAIKIKKNSKIIIWDIGKNLKLGDLIPSEKYLFVYFEFLQNSNQIIIVKADKNDMRIELWNVEDLKIERELFHEKISTRFIFTNSLNSEKQLFGFNWKNEILILEISIKEIIPKVIKIDEFESPRYLEFNPVINLISIYDREKVIFYDYEEKKIGAEFECKSMNCQKFNPSGDYLIYGTNEQSIIVIDIESKKKIITLVKNLLF